MLFLDTVVIRVAEAFNAIFYSFYFILFSLSEKCCWWHWKRKLRLLLLLLQFGTRFRIKLDLSLSFSLTFLLLYFHRHTFLHTFMSFLLFAIYICGKLRRRKGFERDWFLPFFHSAHRCLGMRNLFLSSLLFCLTTMRFVAQLLRSCNGGVPVERQCLF